MSFKSPHSQGEILEPYREEEHKWRLFYTRRTNSEYRSQDAQKSGNFEHPPEERSLHDVPILRGSAHYMWLGFLFTCTERQKTQMRKGSWLRPRVICIHESFTWVSQFQQHEQNSRYARSPRECHVPNRWAAKKVDQRMHANKYATCPLHFGNSGARFKERSLMCHPQDTPQEAEQKEVGPKHRRPKQPTDKQSTKSGLLGLRTSTSSNSPQLRNMPDII